MHNAEPQEPLTKPACDGPKEPESLLCLGGPKHNRTVAWRGEVWNYREDLRTHRYRWVKLSLTQGDTALTKSIYVHDSEDEDYGV